MIEFMQFAAIASGAVPVLAATSLAVLGLPLAFWRTLT